MKRTLPVIVSVLLSANAFAASNVSELLDQLRGVNPDNVPPAERAAKDSSLTQTWKKLVEMGEPAAKEIKAQLQTPTDDTYFQLSASMVLYQIEHEAAHDDIINVLGRTAISDNAFQYFYLCHRIARARDARILPVLRRLLANDKIVVLIDKDSPLLEPRTICTYLYGVYGAESIPSLMDACADANPIVRATAASVLAYFGSDKPLFVLSDLLSRDGNERVRAAAANALGQTDHVAVIDRLAHAISGDASVNVRAACAFALGEVQHERCIDGLALGINDLAPQVRQYAISSLEYIGKERCSEIIGNRLAIEDDPAVRLALVKALGLLGHKRSVPTLKEITEKRSAEEAKAAAEALHRIDSIGPTAREPYPNAEGKKVSSSELGKIIKSLGGKYGEGIDDAAKTIFLSAGKDDLARLEELRCRILYVVNNDTIDRLSKMGKLIRMVKRKTREMI